MYTVSKTEKESTEGEWMTWKQITDKEEVEVLRLMLKNGTLQDRPNPNLDLSGPEVRQLREELKYQYRWVTN